MSDLETLKQLREETAVSMAECQKALKETKGDLEKARGLLKKWGKDIAKNKSSRNTSQGVVAAYIHPNKKVGVLLELNCETDFVAKGKDFQELAHELCLQIAAMDDDPPLLKQPWVKDSGKTVKELIEEYVSKTGENITVKQFTSYRI